VRYPSRQASVAGAVISGLATAIALLGVALTGSSLLIVLLVFLIPASIGLAVMALSLRHKGTWGVAEFRMDAEGIFFGEADRFFPWSRITKVELAYITGPAWPTLCDVMVTVLDDDQPQWAYGRAESQLVMATLRQFAPAEVIYERNGPIREVHSRSSA
jgi:hypothetical protein